MILEYNNCQGVFYKPAS